MVLIRVFLTHEFSIFWIFEPVNGVLTEYRFSETYRHFRRTNSSLTCPVFLMHTILENLGARQSNAAKLFREPPSALARSDPPVLTKIDPPARKLK